MIGTFIRSTHHLMSSGEYLKPITIVGIRHNHAILGEMVKIKAINGRDMFFFFQHANANIDLVKALQYCNKESAPIITHLFNKNNGRCVLLHGLEDLRSYGTQFLCLPDNIDELYDTFVKQNRKVLDPIFGKYLYKEDDIAKLLFAFCESANFFVWAVKNVRGNRISLMTIYRIMTWNNMYGQLVGKLSKGTITAYNTTHNVLELLKECQELRKVKRANDIINLFNTNQKKLLKNNFDKLPIETLSKFAILSKVKQQNFIRKVSTIEDIDEIIRLMTFTTSDHFKWNKQSLLDFIENVEGLNCKVILTNDTSVLVEVNDYDTIKKLAKTTNWCISKNKSYWNNYMGKRDNSVQYIIFDFSKKEDDELSIVGFTTRQNKGITHAHSFTNANLMNETMFDDSEIPYENILQNDNVRHSIYTVISENKIPLSLVTKFKSRFGVWDKATFLKTLEEFISPDNYTIYLDENDKLVLSTSYIQGLTSMFGDTYFNKFTDCYISNEHILFLDFSKDATDDEKMRFTIVVPSNVNKSYKSTLSLYNEYSIKVNGHFNDIIGKFNLPYNIICRPDTLKYRFLESIIGHRIDEMEKYIQNDQIKHLLLEKGNNEVKSAFKRELFESISSYQSMDLLDMIEKYGFSIEDFFNFHDIKNLIHGLYNDVTHCGGSNFYPSATQFDADTLYADLVNKALRGLNRYQKSYIAKCYMIQRIIKPYENNIKALKVILNDMVSSIQNYNYGGYITNYIIHLALKYLDINSLSNELVNILNVVFNHNIRSVIDILLKGNITDETVRQTILAYAPSKIRKEFNSAWGIQEEKHAKSSPKEELTISKIDWSQFIASSTSIQNDYGFYEPIYDGAITYITAPHTRGQF